METNTKKKSDSFKLAHNSLMVLKTTFLLKNQSVSREMENSIHSNLHRATVLELLLDLLAARDLHFPTLHILMPRL